MSQEQTNVIDEAKYIIGRAQRHEARVVELGPLVFFSTDTGDAWMLDPEDRVAVCLARAGEEQPYEILETGSSFSVEWSLDYEVDGVLFIVNGRSGRTTAIADYPTEALVRADRQTRS